MAEPPVEPEHSAPAACGSVLQAGKIISHKIFEKHKKKAGPNACLLYFQIEKINPSHSARKPLHENQDCYRKSP